jgi:amino acid adenylation domain-containing protein/thioester reductase-like protein
MIERMNETLNSSTEIVAQSLVEILRIRAEKEGQKNILNFLEGDGKEVGWLTYEQLDRKARRFAAQLQRLAPEQARVLILLPPSIDYVVAFFGCLYANMVAVPAYPPDKSRFGRTVPRIQAIAADAQAKIVVTTLELLELVDSISEIAPPLRELRWIAPTGMDESQWRSPTIGPRTLAFLQYTSGSTGIPKGVMLTHGHLLHNLRAIQVQMGHSEKSVMISWIPPFHDMGLIVGILQPIYVGFPSVLMAPVSFVRNPKLWLQAISKYRGTTTAAPNFAYDLCVRKVTESDKEQLDLSSWELAINAAEPVRLPSMERFSKAFEQCGFRPEMFYPAYGLAECTVMVSGGDKRNPPIYERLDAEHFKNNQAIIATTTDLKKQVVSIGVGTTIVDHSVRIVDPDSRQILEDGRIGEIWVHGPSVADGYWQREEESDQTFRAKVSDGSSETYLRTGDLGYMRQGEIFITGRIKDMIVINGQNYYPQDIEYCSEHCHPGCRPGCSAAFFLPGELEEQVFLVQEVDPKKVDSIDAILNAIRASVSGDLGIVLSGIGLIAPGSIPKTSSGKIQRQACKQGYLNNEFKWLGKWKSTVSQFPPPVITSKDEQGPSSLGTLDVERWLRTQLALRTGRTLELIDAQTPLLDMGLDSITCIEISAELSHLLQIDLPTTLLLDFTNIANIIQFLYGEQPFQLEEPSSFSRSGTMRVLFSSPKQEQTEVLQNMVLDEIRRHLKRSSIQLETNLTHLGMDSIQAIELQNRIESKLGIAHPVELWLSNQSIANIIKELSTQVATWTDEPPSEIASSANIQHLALGQQAIWFLHELSPENIAYNIPIALEIHSTLDVSAVHRAVNSLVQNHESLRSTFVEVEGKPMQYIHENADVDFVVQDLSKLSASQIKEAINAESNTLFDLENGPLFRVRLYELEQNRYVLLFCFHHIITDFWSISNLLNEFVENYSRKEKAIVPKFPRYRYVDYVRYQQRYLQSSKGEEAQRYWRSKLANLSPVLELPLDKVRPPVQTFEGNTYVFHIDESCYRNLKSLCQTQGTTTYTCLLAIFQVLLFRYSHQKDFVIGTPFSGRTRAMWSDLVGYFINTLPLRAQFTDTMSFLDVLSTAKQNVREAHQYQDYPMSLMVEKFITHRDPSRPPLIQVMFMLQRAHLLDEVGLSDFVIREPGAKATMGDLSFESWPIDQRISQLDLTLTVVEHRHGLKAQFEYNTDLFQESTIAQLAEHFAQLMNSALKNPLEPVRSLSILPQEQRLAMLRDYNQTKMELPDFHHVYGLIDRNVKRSPDSVALRFGSASYTYQDLHRKVTTIAEELKILGVCPNTFVAVCLPSSAQLAITLLAVLKAGGAYIPLDPTYPLERLQFMIQDSKAQLLIGSSETPEELVGEHVTWVDVQRLWELPVISTPSVNVESSPNQWAYMIYTSGSTGKPKGVIVTHRNLINFLVTMADAPGMTSEDVLVSVTSPSFDIFGLELYLPLSVGAELVIAGRDVASNGERLGNLLVRHQASIMQATPATWKLLIDVGFEQFPYSLVQNLLHRNLQVWNMYGPTETTIWSVIAHISELGSSIPIGRPIGNTSVYILDEQKQPVPVGVTGEIWIGGVGVSQGYWGRPELNRERFVSDPFSDEKGAVMYCTGDWGRWSNDGSIYFIGRTDHQVKLRGYRIELGEIESTLERMPKIRQAVAILREFGADDVRLVAFVVGEPNAFQQCQEYLKERLPSYMVPSAILDLPELPLTPNGKIDRKKLMQMPWVWGTQGNPIERQPPVGPVETMLVPIWKDILKVPHLGVSDNFFEVGGYSLLATQLMSRIRTELRTDIPLSAIFEAPTIRELARVLEGSFQMGLEVSPSMLYSRTRSSEPPTSVHRMTLRDKELRQAPSKTVNLEEEGRLPLEMRHVPSYLPWVERPPQNVFLTGATGFLGAFLLHEICQRTDALVHCLVRSTSIEHAYERLRSNLARYRLWTRDVEKRMVPVLGDLAQPNLGMSESDYNFITNNIDIIYHNGARVDFVRSYPMLKPANVQGTIEVLKISCAARRIPMHFISTLSVFPSVPPDTIPTIVKEDDSLELNGKLIHGEYAKSKWVADRIVLEAIRCGYPATIHRPGIVYGHSITGMGKTDDFVHRMVIGSVKLRTVPHLDTWVNLTPVDYVSQAIVHISLKNESEGHVYHLVNPLRLTVDSFFDLVRDFGYPIQRLPYRQWRALIASSLDQLPPNDLLALLPYLSEDSGELFRQPFFDDAQAQELLSDSDIRCRPAARDAMYAWFARLVSRGVLPSPNRR